MADKNEAPRIPTTTGKKSAPANTRGNKGGSLTGSGAPARETGNQKPNSGGKR